MSDNDSAPHSDSEPKFKPRRQSKKKQNRNTNQPATRGGSNPPANSRSDNSNNNNNNNIINRQADSPASRTRAQKRQAAQEFERAYGWNPFERQTTPAMRLDAQKQLDLLAEQVKQMQAQDRYKPPLANLGIGISGSTAKAVRMLVNPEENPAIPLPDQNPGSLVVGKDLLAQSLNLQNGKACVVSSPYGKRQTWVSKTDAEPVLTDLHGANPTYGLPMLIASVNAESAAQPNVFLLEGKTTAAKAGTSLAGVSVNDANAVHRQYGVGFKQLYSGGTSHTAEVVFTNATSNSYVMNIAIKQSAVSFEDALTNNNLLSTASQVLHNGDSWRISGANGTTDASYVTTVPDLVGAGSMYNVVCPSLQGYANSAAPGFQDAIATTEFVPNNSVANGNATVMKFGFEPESETRFMTFEGYTLTAFASIQQGNLLTNAKMMALSTLLSDDAAAINNAGNVVASSIQTGIIPTSGISPISYASSKNLYSYIGQLKRGSYQIFVPDTKYLSAGNTNDHRTPFVASPNSEVWNMVNWIDCSISGVNDNPPAKLPLRVRTCAVMLTPGLQNFIPSMVTPADSTFSTALSFLRLHYKPCCNPTHREEIEKWLQKTFKSAIDHGKTFIKEYGPDLVNGTAKFIQKAAPYVIEGLATL